MLNWQEIHPDFTLKLQKQWEKRGFNYETTKKWINANLTPFESSLAYWLREEKNKDIENFSDLQWVKNNTNLEKLREEFVNQNNENYEELNFLEEEETINLQDLSSENYSNNRKKRKDEKGHYSKNEKKRKDGITEEIDTKKWNLPRELEGTLIFKGIRGIKHIILDKKTIKGIKKIKFVDLPDLEVIKFNLSFQDTSEGQKFEGIDIVELSNLPKLSVLLVNHCCLKDIKIEKCPKINDLRAGNNLLTNLNFLENLNEKELNILSVHSNNLGKGEKVNLAYFNKFENLERLFIDNASKDKISQDIYNRFYGSLSSLQNLNKLKELSIKNTDIDCDEEKLNDFLNSLKNLEVIHCSSSERLGSKVGELVEKFKRLIERKGKNWNFSEETNKFNFDKKEHWKDIRPEFEGDIGEKRIKEWKNNDFSFQQTKEWINAGLNPKNAGLAAYLKKKGYNAEFWKSPFNESEKEKIENRYNFEKWKDKDAQEWLNKEYPEDGICRGEFDKENKGLKRNEIEELDIGGEGLEGGLKLEGFNNLKYLVCRNNQLTDIDISDCCSNLISIDCGGNKLSKLEFANKNGGISLKNLKEFRGYKNKFTNINDIINNINSENLTYFDVGYNDLSTDTNITIFENLTKLQSLYINNNDKLKGSLNFLTKLKEMVDVDIRKTSIKISDLNELPKELEEIYCDEKQLNIEEEQKKYYNKEDSFYNLKAFNDKRQKKIKISKILKIPALTASRKERYNIKKVKENYDDIKRGYYENRSMIYPSEEETQFSWKISEQLPISKLPLRLCYIESEKDKRLNQENNKKTRIKKRINCVGDARYYAILSYSWSGEPKRDVEWSFENAEGKLSLGGKKALNKTISTLKILKESHGLEIKYFWMDQLCINQNDEKEKGHEIPRMREYYGNAAVTLIPVNTHVGEEVIRKLLNSFEVRENRLLYPNKIIVNSLPILEKIIGSEWFSRSWTFQEGFLSKRTIFMFDDFLIDGRFMALIWKLAQVSVVRYEECRRIKDLCKEKTATPIGWAYYEGENKGYNIRDKVALKLNEALWAVKRRERSIPLDGIYSIIGLLNYGRKIEVDYDKDPESVLREAMFIATEYGDGDPLSWYGTGSKTQGLCWLPEIDDINGSSSVTGVINMDYDGKERQEFSFEQGRGIKLLASEYSISDTEKSSGVYSLDREEIVDGGLWMRRLWVKKTENSEEEALTLSGTKSGMKAANKGRVLLVPNKNIWKTDGKRFAILALKVENTKEELGKIKEYLEKNKEIKEITLIDEECLAITKEIKENEVNQTTEIIQIGDNQKELNLIRDFLQMQSTKSINKNEIQDNLRHRLDLVRIEEGWTDEIEKENNEQTFIIGLDSQSDTQQHQAQIEVNPNQK